MLALIDLNRWIPLPPHLSRKGMQEKLTKRCAHILPSHCPPAPTLPLQILSYMCSTELQSECKKWRINAEKIWWGDRTTTAIYMKFAIITAKHFMQSTQRTIDFLLTWWSLLSIKSYKEVWSNWIWENCWAADISQWRKAEGKRSWAERGGGGVSNKVSYEKRLYGITHQNMAEISEVSW